MIYESKPLSTPEVGLGFASHIVMHSWKYCNQNFIKLK